MQQKEFMCVDVIIRIVLLKAYKQQSDLRYHLKHVINFHYSQWSSRVAQYACAIAFSSSCPHSSLSTYEGQKDALK